MEKPKTITLVILLIIILIVLFTSKFTTSKQYEIRKKIRLFPFWIKYLGIVITILTISIHWSDLVEKTVLGSFWQFGLAIGLLVICLSKEKNEDEMMMSVRLNSVFISFFAGIMAHLIFVLLDKLSGGDINSYNSLYATNFILFLYILNFHWTKMTIHE